MAISTGTYADVERVESLVRDLIVGGTFSEVTIPTKEAVEEFLDDVADQINMTLKNYDYISPVLVADDPETFRFIRSVNAAGACALVLASKPSESWSPPQRGAPFAQTRRQFYEKRLKDLLDLIEDRKLPATASESPLNDFVVGSATDSEGNVKKPIFTRNFSDYPGSRDLSPPT